MADILSALPDEVVCHILSFLQTKDAVATSILSKRWNHLWRSVLVLNFPDTILYHQDAYFRFTDIICSVLVSVTPIKDFKISLMYTYSQEDLTLDVPGFYDWIDFLVERGVEKLDLYLWLGMPGVPDIPDTILTCKTLVSLKLRFFSINFTFPSLQLPSLKTLDLEFIFCQIDENFMLLLAGCPILDKLIISKIWGFHSQSTNKWEKFSLTNLTQASIDSTYFHFPLEPLHNVHSLSISTAKMDSYNHVLPTFHNLTSLDLNSFNYRWQFLIQLLKHSPNLQTLKLNEAASDKDIWTKDEETWTRQDDKENWVDPDCVPQCLSLHLKTCHLLSFLGLQGELLLAKYILKNSAVLQTMKIWNGGQPKIKRLLLSCPRASSTCKLTVYHVLCKL
ncbi:FBD-associated F-box protein At5g22730-like [Vicia villosa]|uniref:FBD-associated F-box protein At5g22730-like n=1 Tax=Vicia villosa TaxID=3911 RepID=UPI00273AD7F2|nr:FBD-associated F-box protein At5g22730-like [Vicia villosa]